jgi:hypothetical protein
MRKQTSLAPVMWVIGCGAAFIAFLAWSASSGLDEQRARSPAYASVLTGNAGRDYAVATAERPSTLMP